MIGKPCKRSGAVILTDRSGDSEGKGGIAMVRDLFYEESATNQRASSQSKIYTLFLVVSIICFAVAGVTAFFATSVLPSTWGSEVGTEVKIYATVAWLLFIVLFAGTGAAFFFLKNKFNVSYDYTFVEDELRITKVMNGRRRKYICTLRGDMILKLGWCDKPSYENTLRGAETQKPKILTPNRLPAENKEFIYLLATGELGKRVYVIECRREMLEYLVYAAGKTKLERE